MDDRRNRSGWVTSIILRDCGVSGGGPPLPQTVARGQRSTESRCPRSKRHSRSTVAGRNRLGRALLSRHSARRLFRSGIKLKRHLLLP